MAKIYDVFIPDLGADKDVDLIDVMIKVGDIVEIEDGLITLETEKASMDVPTPYKGKIVEILVIKLMKLLLLLQMLKSQKKKL